MYAKNSGNLSNAVQKSVKFYKGNNDIFFSLSLVHCWKQGQCQELSLDPIISISILKPLQVLKNGDL